MDSTTIVVSTERLQTAADTFDLKIDKVQKAFDRIEKKVAATSYYWEGKGREAFFASYQAKSDKIRTSLARFREEADDLRAMAGIYQASEKAAVDLTASLSSDVII